MYCHVLSFVRFVVSSVSSALSANHLFPSTLPANMPMPVSFFCQVMLADFLAACRAYFHVAIPFKHFVLLDPNRGCKQMPHTSTGKCDWRSVPAWEFSQGQQSSSASELMFLLMIEPCSYCISTCKSFLAPGRH